MLSDPDTFWRDAVLATFAAGAVWLLSGLALLQLVHAWRMSRTERACLVLAVGACVPPLLLETVWVLGWRWSGAATFLWCGLCGLLVWIDLRRARSRTPSTKTELRLPAVLFGFSIVVALSIKLWVVRGLPAGLWGDSLQHTMMAQLLVDNGGIFKSWAPYAPLNTFTYHFGFHANVAFVHWLTGVPTPRALLLVGQLQNGVAMLVSYVFAAQLCKRNWDDAPALAPVVGLITAVLTGFANTQPTFFVNWGRYTQLAGQIILPLVLLAWMHLIEQPRLKWRTVVFVAFVCTGLALTHYIITIFAVLGIFAYVLARWAQTPTLAYTLRLIQRSAPVAVLCFVLFLPWLLNTTQGYLVGNNTRMATGQVALSRVASYAILQPITPFYLKGWMIACAVLGLTLALSRRQWRMCLAGVWSLLFVLTITPHTVGLPGTGIVDSLAGYIALYITAIPLAAFGLVTVAQKIVSLHPKLKRVGQVALAAVVLGVCGWGANWQRDLIDTRTFQLFTAADAKAMQWITANTPADAKFLVNAFPAYEGTLVAGNDGGWWLPFFTQRKTTLPPLTYGTERGETDQYRKTVNQFYEQLRGKSLKDPSPVNVQPTTTENLVLLKQMNVSYIYIGAATTTNQGTDRIDIASLAQPINIRLVYDQDGVKIYRLQ